MRAEDMTPEERAQIAAAAQAGLDLLSEAERRDWIKLRMWVTAWALLVLAAWGFLLASLLV